MIGVMAAAKLKFVKSSVLVMEGYAPGEQPQIGERIVKLNTNENPYPPSPKVLAAVRAVDGESLRRYPDPTASAFRQAAARLWNLSPDHFLCGNGSDDILTIVTRTAMPAGGVLAFPEPTYSLYPILAQLQDATPLGVPWEEGYRFPAAMLKSVSAQAVYVANPNAPTGTIVAPEVLSRFAADYPGLVLIDEAYADFADINCVSLVNEHENVVISRTMSKAYSLAGLRFGYAIANPRLIAEMNKLKDSYNCDAISIAAATAALEDQAYAKQTWENVRSERDRLTKEVGRMGYEALPAHGNFIFVRCPKDAGRQTYTRLKQQGILVRHFDRPGLSGFIRISVGTSNENNALLAGLAEVGSGNAG
jgi:histidinol-phosphate aminotransferase